MPQGGIARLQRLQRSLNSRLRLSVLMTALTMLVGTWGVSRLVTSSVPHSTSLTTVTITILAGGVALAIVVSLVVGLVLSELIRKPVSLLVDSMERAWSRVLAGEPHEPLVIDEGLPDELRQAFAVVDGLTSRFASRQAELDAMVRRATEAAEHLLVAVDESIEGKLLLIDGIVTLANPAGGAHFGQPVARLVGSTLADALGDVTILDSRGDTYEPSAVVRAAIAEPVVLLAISADERRRWLELRAFEHERGGITLLTSRDVSDAKRREDVRQEMLALVSHDLKSPITATGGFLDIIEMRSDDVVVGKAVAGARTSVARTLSLLADVISASKAEDIFAPQTMAPVRLDALIEETAAVYRMSAGHSITVDAPCPTWVRGEARRLHQAIGNLIANAVKYSPEDTGIRVMLTCADDLAEVAVEDDGPGIAPEDRARVFERFERVTTEVRGSGLGLYIVRSIADAHGGYVRIEDTATGRGTRIVIGLPASEPPKSDAPTS